MCRIIVKNYVFCINFLSQENYTFLGNYRDMSTFLFLILHNFKRDKYWLLKYYYKNSLDLSASVEMTKDRDFSTTLRFSRNDKNKDADNKSTPFTYQYQIIIYLSELNSSSACSYFLLSSATASLLSRCICIISQSSTLLPL